MQNIMDVELKLAKKEKMKELDKGLKEFIKGSQVGERVTCPICQYSSRKNKFSAVIFEDSIKCFACGIWRKV